MYRAGFRVDDDSSLPLNFLSSSSLSRPLGSTSTSSQFPLVGRPGLDPGTLGLKETLKVLLRVGLVAHVVLFQGIMLSCVGLVSWCCGNMRPKVRPIRT